MNKKYKVLLLHIIEANGNLNQLVREGLSYKSISELTESLVFENLLIFKDEKIKITELGLNFLETEKNIIKKEDKDSWIVEESKSKIPKIELDFIYLPDQNKLNF
ncbi:hypothetical protein IV494_06825 [Kaistella sp. G5-32]|uniref:ArnR1-like winged helix-turn-helix domain-containing protein n=1 Tax=Kaistella gelatinilytica TaxID=2787636 RepID=A0ABS0FB01_9FLAO|nr:hypothetical protein [Kaistella gelatinilytica]MBF8456894.1 hypothetical protein [Kaistella gelatinilytica]